MANFTLLVIVFLSVSNLCFAQQYTVWVETPESEPLIAFETGQSSFYQVFNPSWVESSPGTNYRQGILIRTQNCPAKVGGTCVYCGGSAEKASVLTFAEFVPSGDSYEFTNVNESSIVFGPADNSDAWGTEDPRIVYNPKDQLYYMFYTAYNGTSILLNLATTPDPTSQTQWTRRGPVFPNIQGSKSGALLIRDTPPHYLFWGDTTIKVSKSNDLKTFENPGTLFMSPRNNSFDDRLVESGPPPLQLTTGDYIFFYNSATQDGTIYHPAWVILDGKDPTKIKQRADSPLLAPTRSWEIGTVPWSCNVPNVVFLEAATPLVGDNRFMVLYGGADAVIGYSIVEVQVN